MMKWIISVFIFTFILIWVCFYSFHELPTEQHLEDVTSNIETLFKNLDRNNDNVLNLSELQALKDDYKILRIHSVDSSPNYQVQGFPEFTVLLGEQIITLEVNFKPLDLKTMKKNLTDLSQNDVSTLKGLLNWKKAHKQRHPFGAKTFSPFLPPKNDAEAGFVWWIVETSSDYYAKPLSNRRYSPPLVNKNNLILHAILSLFHLQTFLHTRFNPRGTVAVVMASSDNFYDIVFRVHAEFQLNKPPLHPFWFTPSQFIGRLIINKDGTVVKFFEMHVPDTKVNVDMEWYNGISDDSMEVDIGHVLEMSVISSAVSVPSFSERGANESLNDIQWKSAISMERALEILEISFFPFKEVKYYNFSEAFKIASAEDKLVHGIVLWGNLADQSC